jgi:polyphenol oxidase
MNIPINRISHFPESIIAFTTQRIRPGTMDGNMGTTVTYDYPFVHQTRMRCFSEQNIHTYDTIYAFQTHSDHVAWIQPKQSHVTLFDIDGMLTCIPGKNLVIITADCIPIFLCTKSGSHIGLLHAGWRGTVRGILSHALRMLQRDGVNLQHVWIHYGPSLLNCCFEITEELVPLFYTAQRISQTHWTVDLFTENTRLALRTGIPEENITFTNHCTGCRNDLYFSYRKEPAPTGRIMSVIAKRI